MPPTKLVRHLMLDALLWLCAPSIFLLAYVAHYSVSSEAILPHLRIVLLGQLMLTLVRIVLFSLIRNRAASRTVSTVFISILLFLHLLYYCMVLIGLKSWGQVISWDLIRSYTAQIPETAGAIGVPLSALLVVPAVVYATLFTATWVYIKKFDWIPLLVPNVRGWLVTLVVASGGILSMAELFNISVAESGRRNEPLSLTLFPAQGVQSLQGHGINKLSADKLDQVEKEARSTYKVSADTNRRNLVVIVVDALRPANMGIYGYERDTTPNLRRLARNSTTRIVSGARSVCSESACGLLSLASSKFVHQFPNQPFTLQQVLKLHGYQVHMILSGDHTNFYGLKQRYGEVDSYFDGSQATGFYSNDDQLVLHRVATLPSWNGAPVMMQFHLMSTHILGKRHDSSIKYSPSANYMLPQNRSAEMAQRAVNFYDNGVVQADMIIHDLLETLKDKGYLRNTLVVITADHGEALGEHGLFTHANGVRDETLRIPLILLSFGYQPAPLSTQNLAASQVDIAPTILAEFGMGRPATWGGLPLQEPNAERFIYFQEGEEVGLLDQRDPQNLWKYWVNRKTGDEYAFNLSLDPKEDLNSIGTAPQSRKQEWRTTLMQIRPVRPRTSEP
jgi:glucan phosphoethanolaminetransferase (alkaline phosphatase superfamily)